MVVLQKKLHFASKTEAETCNCAFDVNNSSGLNRTVPEQYLRAVEFSPLVLARIRNATVILGISQTCTLSGDHLIYFERRLPTLLSSAWQKKRVPE